MNRGLILWEDHVTNSLVFCSPFMHFQSLSITGRDVGGGRGFPLKKSEPVLNTKTVNSAGSLFFSLI